MSGIYIHIPFCKKKCNYCDFFSVCNSLDIENLIKAEITELRLRKDYLENSVIDSIYFGGGTPSILDIKYIELLLNNIFFYFKVNENCEVTLEANPDDLNDLFLKQLNKIGINRLSIGIQSFNNDILKFLGREHNAEMLPSIITLAKSNGFCNISVDLMFGIPGFSNVSQLSSLSSAMELDIQHISVYGLSIEKKSLFFKWVKNKRINELN